MTYGRMACQLRSAENLYSRIHFSDSEKAGPESNSLAQIPIPSLPLSNITRAFISMMQDHSEYINSELAEEFAKLSIDDQLMYSIIAR